VLLKPPAPVVIRPLFWTPLVLVGLIQNRKIFRDVIFAFAELWGIQLNTTIYQSLGITILCHGNNHRNSSHDHKPPSSDATGFTINNYLHPIALAFALKPKRPKWHSSKQSTRQHWNQLIWKTPMSFLST
jgi:hypothetical protein